MQTSQEDAEPKKVESLEMLKSTKMPVVPEIVVPASAAEIEESIIDIQSTREPADDSTLVTPMQEETFQKGGCTPFYLNLDLDLHGQDVSMLQMDKGDVELESLREKEITDLVNTELNPLMSKIAQDVNVQPIAVPNPDMEPEPLLSTRVTETQEQPQATEVLPIASQELTVEKTPLASPSSVNEVNPDLVNPELVNTPTSDLDLIIHKAKTYSESYSRSVTEFFESLTPPAFYELSEETKDEVKSFFRMLELSLAEIATDHTPAFISCVSHLVSKKVLPLSEHIRLEEFWSS